MERFEIDWRKLLLSRLAPVLTRLNKVVAAESAEAEQRQSDIRELYPTPEEATEAYGYGDISEDEYRAICDQMETEHTSIASAARDEVKSIMGRLRRDIKNFEWEMLPETEKERIARSNARYADELKRRRHE